MLIYREKYLLAYKFSGNYLNSGSKEVQILVQYFFFQTGRFLDHIHEPFQAFAFRPAYIPLFTMELYFTHAQEIQTYTKLKKELYKYMLLVHDKRV